MMKNKRFLMKNKCFLTENKRKTAENSGKQVRNASRKQPEQSNKQSFTHNFFKTSNTNTSIYNKKRKRERKKKYFFYRKRRRRRKRKGGKYRKRPERPRPTIPTVHEQQQEKRCMYNGHPIPDNALPRPDNHSQWNDRLQCREPQYG